MIAAQIRPLSVRQSLLLCSKIKWKTITMSSPARTPHALPAAAVDDSSSSSAVDPGCAFKLLLSCPSALPRSRVFVDFDPRYDRIPHPDPNLEESINQIWNQRLQKNPSLYNGLKFRAPRKQSQVKIPSLLLG